jgi:hypothetical protein
MSIDPSAPSRPSTTNRRASLTFWHISLLALTAVAVFICAWIEILNIQSDSYLPRDFADGHTWREYRMTSETVWRKDHSYDDPAILTRPLTVTEAAQMKQDVGLAISRNHMYRIVGTVGLLQYPLVLFLLASIAPTFLKSRGRITRITLGTSFICVLACGTLMLYRGYFSSLGF